MKYPGALPSPVLPSAVPTLIPVSPTVSPARVIVDNSTREVEQRIFYYTNLERVSYGEAPYTWDANLATIARDDCVDMATRDFFNHINPDGETPLTGCPAWISHGKGLWQLYPLWGRGKYRNAWELPRDPG